MKTIHEIVVEVEDSILGRLANKMGNERINNTEILLEYVLKSGGGNHLEIGTLFGGSAIAVALLKKEYGHSGIVLCVDPLNGYYKKQTGHGQDPSGVPVTPDTLFKNIQAFGVGDRIAVIQDISLACDGLIDIEFSTVYIDGEHKYNTPWMDWNRVKNLVTKYVIFDNWDDKHLDVRDACNMACEEYDWEFEHREGITYVVKRI